MQLLHGRVTLKDLIGAGDRIALAAAPFAALAVALNALWPATFSAGGPSADVEVVALALLVPGVVTWLWSVALILIEVPKGLLITRGPFALMKHPIYTSVALLVLPAAGLLLDTWLGVPLGLVVYGAARVFSPDEERELAETFGSAWDAYVKRVKLPWL